MRDIGCLQLDPIRAVERSHRLVVFSRVGPYDLADLDALIFRERKLFEYWAHAASIVLTEDFPLHNNVMRGYPRGDSLWAKRTRAWSTKNRALKQYILKRIRREGPLPSRALEEDGIPTANWVSTGWTSGRNVSRMLNYLWTQGTIMVAGRDGLQKLWDLSERVLPEWTPREKLSEREIVYRAAQKSLRALGVATALQIQFHYIRGRYPNISQTLAQLEREGLITRVEIRDSARAFKGTRYIHRDDLARADEIERGEWQGRTVLLSPFDNLICDRKRTRELYDFDFTIEIYVPPAKRRYGYYVLPILHGDQLIGRVDAAMDRDDKCFNVQAVYAERAAPKDAVAARAVKNAVEELATFLGAEEIAYGKRVARAWKNTLKVTQ